MYPARHCSPIKPARSPPGMVSQPARYPSRHGIPAGMTQDKEWLDLQERKNTLQNLWVPHVFHSTKKVHATGARPRAAMPCGIRRCTVRRQVLTDMKLLDPVSAYASCVLSPAPGLTAAHSGSCRIVTWAGAHPCPPASATGLGSSLPNLHPDCAHPVHIRWRLGSLQPVSGRDWALQIRAARESAAESPS